MVLVLLTATASVSEEISSDRTAAVPEGTADVNWPAFRGPNADGTAKGKPPVHFSAEDGTGVLWKTPVLGLAHASPIVWGDRVFVVTAVPSDSEERFRNGLFREEDLVPVQGAYSWYVMALDKRKGTVLWKRQVHEGLPRTGRHAKSSQANSTPVTDGKHLVTVMSSEGLFCFDLDGNLNWRKDLGKIAIGFFADPTSEWGYATSPILHDGKVILQVDRAGDPFIAAFAVADGRELWRTSRENQPSFGTPAVIRSESGTELITNGTEWIRAYDPADGHELWHLGPHSFTTVSSPVVGHGMVYLLADKPVYAIRPGGRGDISLHEEQESNGHVAWKSERESVYMLATPLLYGDYLYTVANNGIMSCFDARTGERLWRSRVAERGGTAFTASPVAAAGRIYLATEDGDVYVVRHGPEFELLARNPLGEVVMATPAISEDVLFVRSVGHVFAIGEEP
jgi:outer membrane protein assembly factor BamB